VAPLAPQPADAVTTFALIHGAWGDRVAWVGVPDELRRMGHEAVAPDLSCDEPGATFDDDAAIVLGALEDVRGDDVVVVGFSLGDHTAALVAAARPVRELVYLAAMVPEPGVSLSHQFGHGDRMLLREYAAGVEGPDEQGLSRWVDFDAYYRNVVPRLPRACRPGEVRAQSRAPGQPLPDGVAARRADAFVGSGRIEGRFARRGFVTAGHSFAARHSRGRAGQCRTSTADD